ncbi:copper resistance D family protein [Paenibacillus sp. IITD108]|uniref:copper resistance D family protein n=1 Tax=Paenibacillus sp. IITD108 TaxID=3116649 RepID=UPI002F42517F
MLYASEGLLYICFAILTGALLLRLVPEDRRPSVVVPHPLLLVIVAAIPILSFAPIHQLTVSLIKDIEMSYGEMAKVIILEFNLGKAWLWTAVGCCGLFLILQLKAFRNDKHMPYIALFITFLLFVWVGFGSHASSLYTFKGLVVHSLHFMSVSVWIGILFVISWFSRDQNNWESFLRWFSPVAIVCVIIALTAGFLLMCFTTEQYLNSWMLPYGQMMLIKHLLLLPLLLFAFSNGFIYRSVIKKHENFQPRGWLRAESLLALLVLFATAVMGEQAPPHNVKDTLQTTSPSSLFKSFYQGSFSPDLQLQFTLDTESLLMFAAALLMAGGVIWTYRNQRLIPSVLMGLLASLFGYFGLMFAIA